MHILICSIVRNREKYLQLWYDQIKSLVEHNKDVEFTLSVYENDSNDSSVEMLKGFDFSFLKEHRLESENLGTNYYGSIKSEDRVNVLANARNKTLDQAPDLSEFSKVIFIEPDIKYSAKEASRLINLEYDIISGTTPHPVVPIYDNWCTRLSDKGMDWPLNLGLHTFDTDIIPVWTTFNCFCVYNAKPFAEGLRFSGYNDRFETYDCDTAVICEKFREAGYDNIVLDRTFEVTHFDSIHQII